MTEFKSLRVAHEYTQIHPASPNQVFPLLCPVREAEWVPDWQYRLIYSDSGIAELGCIFTTPNTTAALRQASEAQNLPQAEITWITVDYDPAALRIAYVWINPGRVATELRIQLEATSDGAARSHIRFRYTGLSPEGNHDVESYDRKWFERKMRGWESAMNHYLRTGRKIDSSSWE
ncbi:MAG TPA: hypothetical protein VEV41_23500 [Terriglobales bacterium]|nr:hypothetical protein [Terriglobales bacterium]